MPITPHFSLTQTDTHIELNIRVPHVRVTAESIQVVVDDDQVVHFSAPPCYLLQLHFGPHRFHPTAAEACAKYEPTIENGTIFLSLKKEQPGVWENLDLLGKWAPSKSVGVRWMQQVQDHGPSDETNSDEKIATAAQSTAINSSRLSSPSGYGFYRLYHGIFADLTRDGLAQEMLEMPWEEQGTTGTTLSLSTESLTTLRSERRRQRWQNELEKFDAERYLQDLDVQEDYVYQCAMSHATHWRADIDTEPDGLAEKLSNLSLQNDNTHSYFSEKEREQLMGIPYPLLPETISDEEAEGLGAGLIDILFAYVYDHLTTMGDATVESAWTISTLSASLSCLEDWLETSASERVLEIGYSSLRRCLIYPYLRNFDFGCHCLEQIRLILSRGVRCVVRCLLQVRIILDHSELYYLGNKIWLDPYLAWLQRDTIRVESILQRLSSQWPTWNKNRTNLYVVELEKRFVLSPEDSGVGVDDGTTTSGSASTNSQSGDDDDDDDDASSATIDDNSSSDDSSSLGKVETKSDTVSRNLLDENLGRSILHLSPLGAMPSLGETGEISKSQTKSFSLIEEV